MAYVHRRSDDKALVIVDQTTGNVTYEGRPLGHDVERVLPVPESDDCLVLLTHTGGWKTFQNLLRLNPTGAQVWAAEVPQHPDDYVSMEWSQEEGLKATSWSCYRVTLDLETGKIVNAIFVK